MNGSAPPSSPSPLPSSAPAVIELSRASIGYEGHAVIEGMDLAIRAGEMVGVLGPNGSGKSTLVRGILGLTPILSGDLRLFGVPASSFHEHSRIGYVPQRQTVTGGIPATVREVVASGRLRPLRVAGRRPRNRSADRTAISEAIEAVGLSDRASQPLIELSGGQQRRALIARALATRPEVLILDEPTAGVDRDNQAVLADALAVLVAAGTTIVIVTHELGPVEALATRAVVLEEGRVVHDGHPAEAPDEHHHDDDWHHEHGDDPPAPGPEIGLVSP